MTSRRLIQQEALLGLLLWGSCGLAGCVDIDGPPSDGWSVVDSEPSPYVPIGTPAQTTDAFEGPCALEAMQFESNYWIEPRFAAFTPNEGLFLALASQYTVSSTLSVVDGEPFVATDAVGLQSVDRAFERGVFVTYAGGASVRDLDSRETLWAIEGPVTTGAISEGGAAAAFVVCEDDLTRVRLVDIAEGSSRSVDLDPGEPCFSWGASLTRVEFTSDAAYVVATTTAGRLWSIDSTTLETHALDPHERPPEDPYGTTIAAARVRPGAHEVVTTGIDGMLRRWSLPDLEQIGEDEEVGVFLINQNTYAPPYHVSPVAFSRDGRALARVDAAGDVVVTSGAGDTVLPTPVAPEDLTWNDSENVPVTLSFGSSGHRVGVGYSFGPGVWGCSSSPVRRQGGLTLEVPATLRAPRDQAVSVPVTVRGAGPLRALRALSADGEVYAGQFDSGTLRVWPDGSVEQTLVIEADDGYDRARATINIRFIQ